MKREEHVIGEINCYRYGGSDADHALLVLHGLGGHGGIYDPFGSHHADRDVDVWSMDAPGHGRSRSTRPAGRFTLREWVDGAVACGEHIAETTGLPVFVKGSSLGASAAYPALAADVFSGAILMGYAIPSSPLIPADNAFRTEIYERIEAQFGSVLQLNIARFFDFDSDYGYIGAAEQKRSDPLNTWFYDLSSFASIFRYEPRIPLSENTKPILYAVGEKDPTFPVEMARAVVDATAGPVEFHIEPDGVHQLMLFHTESYSTLIADWCREQLKS